VAGFRGCVQPLRMYVGDDDEVSLGSMRASQAVAHASNCCMLHSLSRTVVHLCDSLAGLHPLEHEQADMIGVQYDAVHSWPAMSAMVQLCCRPTSFAGRDAVVSSTCESRAAGECAFYLIISWIRPRLSCKQVL
jgi:hypothetical protein